MTLTACLNCGSQTNPGMNCPRCGTPTPSPFSVSPETGYTAYWQSILERLRRAAAPRYEVTGLLGYGGMAGVFLAREPRLGRNVAIKVMSPALMIDASMEERFEQEARTIALLNHPNIVTIFEVDQREDLHWFTMAHVPGRTLTEVLNEATEPLPISVVAAWFYQMADALAYAHQQGIVHRDVKPANVLLDLRGNAQVSDFGIAKVAGESGQPGAAALTRTGTLVGTPTYMSPEQCTSARITGASDQYSLGVVVYQMLVGAPPFVGPTLAVIAAHVSAKPRFLGDLRSDCPDGFAHAVHRMLEKAPEDRWPTMSAAIAAAGATVPGFDDPRRVEMEDLATPTAHITVSHREFRLREGQRRVFEGSLVSASGRELHGRAVALRPGDMTVADAAGHEIRALGPGATDVLVSSGGARLGIAITVEPDPIRSVAIEPTEMTVAVGERRQLGAVALDLDGTPLEDRALLWRSENPAVARVNGDGAVEGVEPGRTRVVARTGGASATASIIIVEAPLHSRSPQHSVNRPAALAETVVARRKMPRAATPSQGSAKPIAPIETPEPAAPSKRRTAIIAGVALTAVVAVVLVLQPWRRNERSVLPVGDGAPTAAPSESIARGVTVPPAAGGRTGETPGANQANAPAPNTPAAVPAGNISVAGALPPDGNVFARDTANVPYPISTRPTPLRPGTYRLEFRAAGFAPRDSTVLLRSGQSVVWNPQIRAVTAPTAAAPREATLIVRGSVPQGGLLIARDSADRSWPLVGERTQLPPGRYALEFRAVGYEPETRQVTLQPGESETWSPAMRALPQPAAANPPTDARADQAAIEALVREFQAAFNRRDTSIVRLLPPAERDSWSNALRNRAAVTAFSVSLGSVETPRITGDNATVQFTLEVAFRSANQNVRQALRYVGTARRGAAGWQLVSLATQRE